MEAESFHGMANLGESIVAIPVVSRLAGLNFMRRVVVCDVCRFRYEAVEDPARRSRGNRRWEFAVRERFSGLRSTSGDAPINPAFIGRLLAHAPEKLLCRGKFALVLPLPGWASVRALDGGQGGIPQLDQASEPAVVAGH